MLSFVVSVEAQENPLSNTITTNKASVEPHTPIGINVTANYITSQLDNTKSSTFVEHERLNSFGFSITKDFAYGPVTLESGLSYETLGDSYEVKDIDNGSIIIFREDLRYEFKYLTIPGLVSYDIWEVTPGLTVFVMGGAKLGFLLDAKAKSRVRVGNVTGSESTNVKDEVNFIDPRAAAGLGVKLFTVSGYGFIGKLEYQRSLSRVNERKASREGDNLYNESITLGLGLML